MPYESIPDSPGPSLPGADDEDAVLRGIQQTLGGDKEVGAEADQPTLMESDAADSVYAKDLAMSNSAAVAASVLGDMVMDNSAVVLADVTGGASLRESVAGALVSEGPVDLQGGLAGIVVAREFTVRDGGTVLMTEREAVIFGAVFAGVLVAGWLALRAVFGRR